MSYHSASNSVVTNKVLLVDGYPIVRLGLQHLIDGFAGFSVAATASTRQEAISVLQSAPIDLVVTSLAIGPRDDGLMLLSDIREKWPQLPSLVLSGKSEEEYSIRAFQSGAKGYVQKNASPDKILTAMTTVTSGGAYFSRRVGSLVVTKLRESGIGKVA